MKIGIMDSGIGGLTVLRECLAELPEHDYLYYADSKNAPYGMKTPEEVYELTKRVVENLIELGAEIIVLACNTATSAAAARLRETYDFPIIGMEPALKPALAVAGNKRVLVTATELTLKQPKFRNLIDTLDAHEKVDYVALTDLVTFAETGEFSRNVILPYLTSAFSEIDLADYGSVVLGCTHFPLFKAYFSEICPPGIVILDGAHGTTKRIKDFVTKASSNSSVRFFVSGEEVTNGVHFDLMQRILK